MWIIPHGLGWWNQWFQLPRLRCWYHSCMLLLVTMLRSKVSVVSEEFCDVCYPSARRVYCEVHGHTAALVYKEISDLWCFLGCFWHLWSYPDPEDILMPVLPAVTSNHGGVHFPMDNGDTDEVHDLYLLPENLLKNSQFHTDAWDPIEVSGFFSEQAVEIRLMSEILSATVISLDVPDACMYPELKNM